MKSITNSSQGHCSSYRNKKCVKQINPFPLVIGNLMVMSAVVWRKEMRTARNIFIFNLAFSDFLLAISVPLTVMDALTLAWPLPSSLLSCRSGVKLKPNKQNTGTSDLGWSRPSPVWQLSCPPSPSWPWPWIGSGSSCTHTRNRSAKVLQLFWC